MARTPKNLTFEDALDRLDDIVSAMESGEIGIEESISRYEEAMKLHQHCRAILDRAEQRIKQIQANAAGKLQVQDFQREARPTAADDDEDDDGNA